MGLVSHLDRLQARDFTGDPNNQVRSVFLLGSQIGISHNLRKDMLFFYGPNGVLVHEEYYSETTLRPIYRMLG